MPSPGPLHRVRPELPVKPVIVTQRSRPEKRGMPPTANQELHSSILSSELDIPREADEKNSSCPRRSCLPLPVGAMVTKKTRQVRTEQQNPAAMYKEALITSHKLGDDKKTMTAPKRSPVPSRSPKRPQQPTPPTRSCSLQRTASPRTNKKRVPAATAPSSASSASSPKPRNSYDTSKSRPAPPPKPSGLRSAQTKSRIPTSPPSKLGSNLSLATKPQATGSSTVSGGNSSNNKRLPPHRPGHLPAYLNKSTPSLAVLRNNARNAKSRPTSRDMDGKVGSSNSNMFETLMGESRPLAPTAKFRSDGEISICCEAKRDDVTHIYESVGEPPVRPPRATTTVAKSHHPCATARTVRGPPQTSLPSSLPTANERANAVEDRLSAEVQCWPWGVPACVQQREGERGRRRGREQERQHGQERQQGQERRQERQQGRAVEAARQSRSYNSSLKSASLGSDGRQFLNLRSRSLSFFQRLGGLRRSLSSRSSRPQHLAAARTAADDVGVGVDEGDWVFFRGFGGKRPEEVLRLEPYATSHGPLLAVEPPHPQPPPRRRKRPPRPPPPPQSSSSLKRALSLTDAHFIAQAVYEGDAGLIEELYPDFPRSTPIYAVVDFSKKKRNRQQKQENRQSHPPVRLTPIPGSSSDEGGNDQKKKQKSVAAAATSAVVVGGGVGGGEEEVEEERGVGGSTPSIEHRKLTAAVRGTSPVKDQSSPSLSPRNGASQDGVTFTSSVMFVKQASDLQNRRDLPDLVHHRLTSESPSSPTRTVVSVDMSQRRRRGGEGVNAEPPPVISPWNNNHNGRPGSTYSSAESSSSNGSDYHQRVAAAVHPYAQRAQLHYAQQLQHDVAITTSRHGMGGVTLTPSSLNATQELNLSTVNTWGNGNVDGSCRSLDRPVLNSTESNRVPQQMKPVASHAGDGGSGSHDHQRLDESFRKILARAGSSIDQAESILSSLRAETTEILESEEESEPASLGSDIETNIRRLERTQAKINAALETFRHVQASGVDYKVKKSNRENFCSLPPNVMPPKTSMTTPQQQRVVSRQISTPSPLRQHHQQPVSRQISAPSPQLKSKTAPGNLQNNNVSTADGKRPAVGGDTPTSSQQSSGKPVRKPSLFRRHSFSSAKDKIPSDESSSVTPSSSSQRESSVWYEGDVESQSSTAYDDPCSFSDSEGGGAGFLPLRNKLRGLLGSFGKGRKKVHRSGSNAGHARQSADSLSDVRGDDKLRPQHPLPHPQSSPALKATLGEFTRQIESLSAKGQDDEEDESFPTRYYRARVTTTASTSSLPNGERQQVLLRHHHHHQPLDKYSSVDSSSNRNSVLSSSDQSFEDHSDDDDQEGGRQGSSNSSPHSADAEDHQLTPQQRHDKKVFFIAKEILTSERVFVDVLRLINVEFREFMQRARKESKSGILPDADFSRIFSNLPELQALNEDLLQDFEERIRDWDRVKKIADVIVKKGPFLKLYTTYIREFSSVNYHFDECCQKYPKFGKLVREFEKKDRCRHLKLKHFMLKPVQRLPQYRLLLEDYLKHLHPESEDFDDTANALRIVSDAADHANDTMKQGDQFRKMLKLQHRLGDELIRPGRELIREGELQKISRKGIGPRYFVLLSDCLLYCSYTGGGWTTDSTGHGLRVTYKIPLTALQVRAPAADDFQCEFDITSPVRSCTLRASSVNERNEWLEALSSAIEEHVSRRATFASAIGDQKLVNGPAKVGNSAPVWVPDRRVTMCQHCAVEFSVLVRRHHCRACGKVVCATCSGNKAPLRYRDFEPARVCDDCFEFLDKELGHLESLKFRFKKRDTSKNSRYVPPRLRVNGEEAQMCGYLKRRLKGAKWKKMWFVLKDKVLYAYKASEDTVASETFPLLGYQLDSMTEKNFEVYEGEQVGLVFLLAHPAGGETLAFSAENSTSYDKWLVSIRDATKLDAN